MKKERFIQIDFLRAVGIIGVMATHVYSYALNSPLNSAIWDYLHFVITPFVFCSGYVLYAFSKERLTNFISVFPWYKKRILRLLIPFYIYALIHTSLMFLFPKYFSGLGIQLTKNYLFSSVFLTGGINQNWLPLLFIELALLFPILLFFLKRQKALFYTYVFLAILFTLGITIWPAPYSLYRWIMWIPWSLVFVLSWLVFSWKDKKNLWKYSLSVGVVSLVLFLILRYIWVITHRHLFLIDNKYPPNFYYISFEFALSSFIFALSFLSVFAKKTIVNFYTFLSNNSYNLFFIHFLVLDFILQIEKMKNLHIDAFFNFLIVASLSMAISWSYSSRKRFLPRVI